MANISESFTHKMASKTSRHRYESNLRHYHPVYSMRNEREIRKVANRNIGSCDTEELCEEREATRARGRFTVRRRCRGGTGCHRGRVADLETRRRGSYAVNRSRNGLSSRRDPPAWCSVYLAAAKLRRRRRRAPGSVMAARTALNVRSARERKATRPGRPADRLPVPTGNALWFVCWRARRAQGTPWPRRHRVATNSTFSADTIPPPQLCVL